MVNSVKTGQPPQFGGSSGGDLSTLIPGVASSIGIEDIGKAIDFYKKHRNVFQAILKVLGLGGKPKPVVVAPTPQPDTSPGPAPGGNTGTPTKPTSSVPTPTPEVRRVASLKSKYTLIERKRNLGEFGGGRYILPKDEFDQIVSGEGFCRPGDRLHVDITPVDQFGVAFAPGDEANNLLLKDVGVGQDESNFRITHDVDGAEITSGYNDFGCTPVLLVPWEGVTIDSDEKWNVNYQAQYNGPGGRGDVIQAPALPTIRVVA